jgi:CheY-like chemotaxis protein
VEDEPLGAELIQRYIERTPFLKTAATVARLQEAVKLIHQQKPDIVFLDVNTRSIDKTQIQELVRRKDILFIFTTAYPKPFVEEALEIEIEASGLGYLSKPIRYESFVRELERLIPSV